MSTLPTTPAISVKKPATYELRVEPSTAVYAGQDVKLVVFKDGAAISVAEAGNLKLQFGPAGKSPPDPVNAAWEFKDADSPYILLHTEYLADGDYDIALYEDTTELVKSTVKITSDDNIARNMVASGAETARRTAEALETLVDDGISVNSTKRMPTSDQALWTAIRGCTQKRAFDNYDKFIQTALCTRSGKAGSCEAHSSLVRNTSEAWLYRYGSKGFALLETATEVFLLCRSCCCNLKTAVEGAEIDVDEESARFDRPVTKQEIVDALGTYLSGDRLPYVDTIVKNLQITGYTRDDFPFCQRTMRDTPCLYELIWSYWHEMGYLAQTMAAITARFQNIRVGGSNALAMLTVDPLRPINNLMWGYVQAGKDWLTVRRRAGEYGHEYGLTLQGKAVGDITPADPRSRFLEAFHQLLGECAQFYKDDANKWIDPDPYPLLNSIIAVHLLLAEGAHNQFGDLPFVSRKEMLIQQWLLAQPPMTSFLQSRPMIPYDEPWMGQVDSMKKLMGWTDTSVIHFNRLAVFGERLLLSIRYGNWNDRDILPDQAANWAVYWRTEVQGYIHAYKTVTGVDLSGTTVQQARVDATPPSVLIARRTPQSTNALPENEFAPTSIPALNGRITR
jgi:hypothetical protein